MGRPQLVTDEDIRTAALALLAKGERLSVAKVRARLIETKRHGGEPARISREIGRLTQDLAQSSHPPLAVAGVPEGLQQAAGMLFARIVTLANEEALKAFDAHRQELENDAAEKIAGAETALQAMREAHAGLAAQLRIAQERNRGLEVAQTALNTRIESLTGDLAAARATLAAQQQASAAQLDEANRRIAELEAATRAAGSQSTIDLDALVARIAQAAKGKDS